MAPASSAQREPSMEEILASIRRIIEDSDTATNGRTSRGAFPGQEPAPAAVRTDIEAFRAELRPAEVDARSRVDAGAHRVRGAIGGWPSRSRQAPECRRSVPLAECRRRRRAKWLQPQSPLSPRSTPVIAGRGPAATGAGKPRQEAGAADAIAADCGRDRRGGPSGSRDRDRPHEIGCAGRRRSRGRCSREAT